MGLFNKKNKNSTKIEAVENYAVPEQDELPEAPQAPQDESSILNEAIRHILNNQKIIVENQQMILNAVGNSQELMVRLAQEGLSEDEDPDEEEELSDEEIEAAMAKLKEEKKAMKKKTPKKKVKK